MTDLADTLRDLWSGVLRTTDIPADANFFELGGHSMLAARLIARARTRLGVALPMGLVFDHPVFADFAAQVAEALRRRQGQPVPAPAQTRRDRGPLSLQQRQFMRVEDALGPSPVNVVTVAFEVGAVRADPDALRRAVHGLYVRHASLRTAFRPGSAGTEQVVLPPPDEAEVVLDRTDLSGLAPAELSREVRRRVRQGHRQPFDLAAGRLLRTHLLHRGGLDDLLVLHLHHLATDGPSRQVLVADLVAKYAGGPVTAAPAAGVTYLDYAVWQDARWRSTVRESVPYWRGVVRELTAGRGGGHSAGGTAGPATSLRFARSTAEVKPDVTAAIRGWGAADGTTVFTALAAALAAALARLTGRDRIGLGTLLENRPFPEVERTVGPFATSTLLPVAVPPDATPRSLVRTAAAALGAAREWSDIPLDVLIAEPAADAAVEPADLVDAVLAVEYAGEADGTLGLRPVVDGGRPLLPLAVGAQLTVHALVAETGEVRLTVEHTDEPVPTAHARAVLDTALALLDRFAAEPDRTLAGVR